MLSMLKIPIKSSVFYEIVMRQIDACVTKCRNLVYSADEGQKFMILYKVFG